MNEKQKAICSTIRTLLEKFENAGDWKEVPHLNEIKGALDQCAAENDIDDFTTDLIIDPVIELLFRVANL